MTDLSRSSSSRPALGRVFGPVVLVAALTATGCGAGSATPTPSASASAPAGPARSSAFRQCLERHGVNPPQGRPAGGSPHSPPPGGVSGTFRQAVQACGGGSFPGHAGSAG